MMMMMMNQQQQHQQQPLSLIIINKLFTTLRFSCFFFLLFVSLLNFISGFTINTNNIPFVVLTTTKTTITNRGSTSNHRRNMIGTKLQQQQEEEDHVYEQQQQKVGLYIHIPYCQKRCYYCNFDIIPIGTTTSSNTSNATIDMMNDTNIPTATDITFHQRKAGFDKMNELYVQTLIKELDLIYMQHYLDAMKMNNKNMYNNTYNMTHKKNKIILQSIYFGGGTPSLLPIKSLQYIMNHIKTGSSNNNDMNHRIYNDDTYNNHNNTVSYNNNYNYNMFQLQNDTKLCEVTIEIDPNTNHDSNELHNQIQTFKNIGINRFSFGIQSFDNSILSNLGRTHTTNDIYNLLHILTGNSSSHNNRSNNSINQNQHNEQPQELLPFLSSPSILSDSHQQPSQSMNRSRSNTKSIITATSTTNNNDDYDTTSPTITTTFANINNNNRNNSHSIINYSIDLICGMVPGLTITKWMETLYNATKTTRNQHQNQQNHNHHHHPPIYQLPTHFSIYDLQIEDQTIYGKLYSKYRDDDEVIDNDDADNNNEHDKLSPTKQTLVATTSRASVQQSSSSSSSSKMIQQQQQQQQQQTNVNYKVGYKNKLNNVILPSYQDAEFMYKYTSGYLRAKHYEHYEISSYAYIPPSVSSSTSISSKGTIDTKELINVEDATYTNQNVIDVREEQHLSSLQSPYRSQHNQIYWGYNNISSWYAIGLGATSYVHGKIIKRPKTMYEYIQWVNTQYNQTYNEILNYINNNNSTNVRSSINPTTATTATQLQQSQLISENIDNENNMMMIMIEEIKDIVLKRLRTSDGLFLEYIQEQYGPIYVNAIQKGIQLAIDYNMAIVTPPQPTMNHTTNAVNYNNTNNNTIGNHTILRLTDPIGFLYSNTIISNIFYELDNLHKVK